VSSRTAGRAPLSRALTLLAAVAAVAALTIACGKGDQPRAALAATTPGAGAGIDTGIVARADDGRLAGREDATVWLIEISDFQCPYCKQWHDSTYPAIRRDYVDAGRIRMAYVNLPLTSHKHAQPAAEAAMCAAAQDKFWPVHDAIFDAQERWARLPDAMPAFTDMARAAGVEMTAWQRCVQQHQTRDLIEADAGRAQRSGIGSTPSFIVGNQLIAGAYPLAVFRQVLDSALATAARGGAK
jgi:protein-disulfide isomerase